MTKTTIGMPINQTCSAKAFACCPNVCRLLFAVLSFVPLPILSLCLTSRASPTEWRSVHAVFVLCYLVIDEVIFGFGLRQLSASGE